MDIPELVSPKYGTSEPYTIGIEEELQLVDGQSLLLSDKSPEVLKLIASNQIKPELFACMVEIATKPHLNLDEAKTELMDLRQTVKDAAASFELKVISSGTHPFAKCDQQAIYPDERYDRLLQDMAHVAKQQLAFGLHIHIGMPTTQQAIYTMNCLRNDLPLLAAMSGNSPFWEGLDTQLQSYRRQIINTFPRTGLPPLFSNFEEYKDMIVDYAQKGIVKDTTFIWHDIRLHPRYGTIEIRIFDAQARCTDSIALASFVQALAAYYGNKYEQNIKASVHTDFLLKENQWLASRYGLDAKDLIYNHDSLQTRLSEVLLQIMPFAKALGNDHLLNLNPPLATELIKLTPFEAAQKLAELY